MSSFQSDLDSISSWLSSHFLQINSSKSKYIFFSHKSFSYLNSFPKLTISQSPTEHVSSFCYLDIIVSSSLSWPHISFVCNKSRKILGLLFQHFLLTLLLQLSLDSTSPLFALFWDMAVSSGILLLLPFRFCSTFHIKIASKFCFSLISIILSEFNIPSLASCHPNNHLLENIIFIILTFLLPFVFGTFFLPHLKKLTLSPSSSLS